MTGRAHPRTADVTTLPSGSQQRLSILFRVRAECPQMDTYRPTPHNSLLCETVHTTGSQVRKFSALKRMWMDERSHNNDNDNNNTPDQEARLAGS